MITATDVDAAGGLLMLKYNCRIIILMLTYNCGITITDVEIQLWNYDYWCWSTTVELRLLMLKYNCRIMITDVELQQSSVVTSIHCCHCVLWCTTIQLLVGVPKIPGYIAQWLQLIVYQWQIIGKTNLHVNAEYKLGQK
jgi:hypothetical protein